MSASSKKKLRKEQNTANMTEKQLAAKKEEKKLKIYTVSFLVVIALCVCLVAGLALRGPVASLSKRITTAVVIGDHKLSTVDLNYFYIDYINNFSRQYGSNLSYFIDATKPISEQIANQETKATYADEFLDQAIASAKYQYALYDTAVAEGHKLTEQEQADLDNMIAQTKAAAKTYGYPSFNAYLQTAYGEGANQKTYREYCGVSALAQSYYTAHSKELEDSCTTDALRKYEADKMGEFNSYSYATYKLNVEQFKEGGTKGEDGQVTYSDEEVKKAEEAVKAAAEAMAISENNTVETLNAAIAAYEQSKMTTPELPEATSDTPSSEADKTPKYTTCTENKDVLYTSVTSSLKDWVSDDARQVGEIAAVPDYRDNGDGTKTLLGYYVVLFQGKEDNTFALKNVRHILVSYEGGTQDENGKTTYSDAEKAAAKEKAEAILKEWTDGAKTEESFAALAKEKTTDPGSAETGGLYEAVYPGQMVDPFNDWTFDKIRKAGDTGIVETEYGYHVMFFSGDNETSYRDYLVKNALSAKLMEDWEAALDSSITVTRKNLNQIERDLLVSESGITKSESHAGHNH